MIRLQECSPLGPWKNIFQYPPWTAWSSLVNNTYLTWKFHDGSIQIMFMHFNLIRESSSSSVRSMDPWIKYSKKYGTDWTLASMISVLLKIQPVSVNSMSIPCWINVISLKWCGNNVDSISVRFTSIKHITHKSQMFYYSTCTGLWTNPYHSLPPQFSLKSVSATTPNPRGESLNTAHLSHHPV